MEKINQETLDELIEAVQDCYDLKKFYAHDSFYSIEKDIKEAFKIKKDFVFDTFSCQARYAGSYKGIPLRCTLSDVPESKSLMQHNFENLLTGEVVETNNVNLSSGKIEENDKYEFWLVWLKNPNKNERQENYMLPVVTRPLDLQETETKTETEIKLKF